MPQAKVKDPLKRTNAVGIVGFLFSFFAFLFSAGIFSFPGFLVSCVGVGVRKQYNKGNGTAIAGLVFAILGLLIFGFILYLIITGEFSDLLARFDIYLD
ncbi:MAG: hypothetical protein LUD50_01715 [Clostridia bacterium]|nr:hypothetical protein [Clostridia bacterium]